MEKNTETQKIALVFLNYNLEKARVLYIEITTVTEQR